MIDTLFAYDATSRNEHVLPTDVQALGYDTQAGGGTGFIAWTPAQWTRHTNPFPAMHIDQDQNASDTTADFLDVEAGAATEAEIVRWIDQARVNFYNEVRPLQRWPGIYCSESNLSSCVGLLINAGVDNVPFWIANYGYTEAQATAAVANAVGPYPRVGHQFTDKEFGGLADGNIFSLPYVTTYANSPTEAAVQFATLTENAYVPFPAGSFKQITFLQDFVTAANESTVRFAQHSKTGGWTVNDVVISAAVPHTFLFTDTDTDGVSLVLASGAGPVGYCLA